MRFILGLMLTTIYLTLILINYKKTKDIFSPICFYSVLRCIFVLPGVFVKLTPTSIYDDDRLLILVVYEILSLIFICLGINFYNKIKRKYISYEIKGYYKNHLKNYGIFLFSIGFISVIYLIYRLGGISYIFANIHLRAYFLRGQGYINLLGNCTNFGVLCYLIYWSKNRKKIGINVTLLLLVLLASLSKIVFGARAPLLTLLMTIAITYNYSVKRINFRQIFSIRFLLLTLVIMLFVVMFPMIRSNEMRYLYSSPNMWLQEGIRNLTKIAEEFTVVDRDIFVISNFKLDNFWFGKGYLDLLYAPIPSNLLQSKPPVDDGVYLANMMLGYDIHPNTAFVEIPFKSSVPFTSFGILYANAGVIGVIIGMFITGVLYQFVYKVLKDTNYDVFMIIVYQVVLYTFKPSNLAISLSLQTILLAWFCFKLFGGMKIKRTRLSNRISAETNCTRRYSDC